MNDSSIPIITGADQVEPMERPTPKYAYDEFAKAFVQYLRWLIIGVLVLIGASLTASSVLLMEVPILHDLFRDIGIAILVAAIIAVVYETYARFRFELRLMTSFLGAVIADWSRQDVWNALKAQIIEKTVIRENFRVGVRLLRDSRLPSGQMLLKLNVEYNLRGLRSDPTHTTIDHFLDWHFKIKGHNLPRFNCVKVAGQDIPTDSRAFNDRGEFRCRVRVPAKDHGVVPVASLREDVVYFPGTHCFVLNEITKGLEICLDEIPEDISLFVTVRPHPDLKYRELRSDAANQRIESENVVLFPGQIIELLFQPKEESVH
jgi:hypothetical protein